ncbi:CinA family protein [Gammaproteobacteria bacterium]|nr:CinA family protein [Gammaproteobacteria bacterium]
MTKTDDLVELARQVGQIVLERGWHLATVESCTGGWVAKVITSVPGSSLWFECALVTYSNESKNRLAGVPMELIDTHGAVSSQVSEAMAGGIIVRSNATAAIAVTGIAGPDGGSVQKPVGTVFIAWQVPGHGVRSQRFQFHGDRDAIRRQSVAAALAELISLAADPSESQL